MNIYIFSHTKKVRDYFKVHRKTNHFSTPEFLPREDLKKIINQAEPGTLIYIDLSGLSETEITKYLRLISKNEYIFYGILDPAHKIKDIAILLGCTTGTVKRYLHRSTLKLRKELAAYA